MTELALIRSLMDKKFYEEHKGSKSPDKIFSKDVIKIKQVLDYSMKKYEKDLTVDELQALFMANNPTMTTANRQVYVTLFDKLGKQQPMNNEIASDVLSSLFRQMLGEEIANIGFDYVNGKMGSLEPLRRIIHKHNDDFLPNLDITWEDISVETLLRLNNLEAKWKFNLPTLKQRIEGISDGHLVMIGARPNTGKTSFQASIIAGPGGFVDQGARCVILTNEEAYHRVGIRYMSAATGMSRDEMRANPSKTQMLYKRVLDRLSVKDCTDKYMDYVELVIKAVKPDIVVLDMGDKFAMRTSDKTDVYLKDATIHARNMAKIYNCAVLWMSQLSAEAEGRVTPNQSMLEGSKTGKAAETDLMLLLSKDPMLEGEEETDIRHIVVSKNKLNGWHGTVTCRLDKDKSFYMP